MWGDYHARELALLIGRYAEGRDYRYFDCVRGSRRSGGGAASSGTPTDDRSHARDAAP
jgi:hypothetical protein